MLSRNLIKSKVFSFKSDAFALIGHFRTKCLIAQVDLQGQNVNLAIALKIDVFFIWKEKSKASSQVDSEKLE